jgi:hypothetical protein
MLSATVKEAVADVQQKTRQEESKAGVQRPDLVHLSMRLRPIEQIVARVAVVLPGAEQRRASNTTRHGCAGRSGMVDGATRSDGSVTGVGRCNGPERTVGGADGDRLRRYRRHLVGLSRYLRGNAPLLFNYGSAWRTGSGFRRPSPNRP